MLSILLGIACGFIPIAFLAGYRCGWHVCLTWVDEEMTKRNFPSAR
jgi:hypothetical protein